MMYNMLRLIHKAKAISVPKHYTLNECTGSGKKAARILNLLAIWT
jgi:hypothetical protein